MVSGKRYDLGQFQEVLVGKKITKGKSKAAPVTIKSVKNLGVGGRGTTPKKDVGYRHKSPGAEKQV